MAIVIFGGGVSQISGSIAGNTFSRNSYGAYVRNRAIPVNPNSPRQQSARANLSAAVAQWGGVLTESQRQAWRDYAAQVPVKNSLGQNILLTGQNMFIRTATARSFASASFIADAPVIFSLGDTDDEITFGAAQTGQEILVDFDTGLDWIDEDDSHMLLYTGRPQNPSRNFFNGPFRFTAALDGDSTIPITSPQPITSEYVISETQKLWIGARIAYADGRLTNMLKIGPEAVAG